MDDAAERTRAVAWRRSHQTASHEAMTALARGTQRKLARTACGYRRWRAFWGDRVTRTLTLTIIPFTLTFGLGLRMLAAARWSLDLTLRATSTLIPVGARLDTAVSRCV